jgi:polyphenol oxidase
MHSEFDPDWLRPEWAAADCGAVMTTRRGGVSLPPFDSMNMRDGSGADPFATAHNRARLDAAVGVPLVSLNQVHGTRVVHLTAADVAADAPVHDADACVTTARGLACSVQVADCLPVLFAAPGAVAAAHAGWRGLAAGVLEATVDALCAAAACRPNQVHAWLGPCIGPQQFEVGAEVVDAFAAWPPSVPRWAPIRPGKWLVDLPAVARDRLQSHGVRHITGGLWCTVTDASRFFSYRRDGVTGRMVAAIWRTD